MAAATLYRIEQRISVPDLYNRFAIFEMQLFYVLGIRVVKISCSAISFAGYPPFRFAGW